MSNTTQKEKFSSKLNIFFGKYEQINNYVGSSHILNKHNLYFLV